MAKSKENEINLIDHYTGNLLYLRPISDLEELLARRKFYTQQRIDVDKALAAHIEKRKLEEGK